MRTYTIILSLVMAVLMIPVLLCGCAGKPEKNEAPANTRHTTVTEPKSETEKIEALAGTWYMTFSESESSAQALLELIHLDTEEIACVDLTTLETVKIVNFTTDKTYRYGYDPDGTKACARAFFEGAFYAMYENRAFLGQLYNTDFEPASKDEFLQFYAELYGAADFSELLDKILDNCYDYDAMAQPLEEGTFSIEGDVISMTILGQSEAETLEYSLGSGVLMLTYADSVEVYSRGQ